MMISHVAKIAEVSNYIGSFGAFLTLYYVQTLDQIVICQTAKPRVRVRGTEEARVILWRTRVSGPCFIVTLFLKHRFGCQGSLTFTSPAQQQ